MGLITATASTYYGSSNNYGNYIYTPLSDIVKNFELAYVGEDKLIPKAKRTDILFHAMRGMQEFSYDLLKSVKSMELAIPPSLSLALPQDYVNYVKLSWSDSSGIEHTIYPMSKSSNPTSISQNVNNGDYIFDGQGKLTTNATSKTLTNYNSNVPAENQNFDYDYDDNYD